MDNLRSRQSTPRGRVVSTFAFWLIALIPAISIVISYSYFYLPLPYSSFPPGLISFFISYLIPQVIVSALVGFLVNLIIPVAIDKRKALLFAIPVSIVYFYFYLTLFFWVVIQDTLHTFNPQGGAFQDIQNGILFFPVEILVLVLTYVNRTRTWRF